ncbi:hypothetical protein NQ318_017126, partial [Aromia moschata]
MDATARVGLNCRIGPNVTIGPGACGPGRSTILGGVTVRSNSWLDGWIVGWRCCVGRWVRMGCTTGLGEDVTVKDEIYINGGKCCRTKTITASVPTPQDNHVVVSFGYFLG